MRGVVAREHLQLAAQRGAVQQVEQRLDGGKLGVPVADYQVVALGGEGDEMKAEGSRGGPGGDAAIGFVLADGLRRRQVPGSDPAVSVDLVSRDACGA